MRGYCSPAQLLSASPVQTDGCCSCWLLLLLLRHKWDIFSDVLA